MKKRKLSVYKRAGSQMYWAYFYAGGRPHRKTMGTADEDEAWEKAREWRSQLEAHYAAAHADVRLSAAVGAFLNDCREGRLAKLTIKGYASKLRLFSTFVGEENLATWSPEYAFDKVSAYLKARAHDVSNVKPDRLVLSAFFNFLQSKRWYSGQNPANAELYKLRRPRKPLKKPKRCTTDAEDLILRKKGPKNRLWPVILLTRWAGMRRGEACLLRWSEIDLEAGFADVVGHEGGRKHPRRVWLAPWVVLQLRTIRPSWMPEGGDISVWPHNVCWATQALEKFCREHLTRKLSFHDLRASFTTDCFENGLTAKEESKLVGHSAAVAEKHYDEHDAREARHKLPPDPMTTAGDDEPDESAASKAAM